MRWARSNCRLHILQFHNFHQTSWRNRCPDAADAASVADRCTLCRDHRENVNLSVALRLQKIVCNIAGLDHRKHSELFESL